MFAIEARNLVKSFRGTPAVGGVDLLVDEGDLVALLGANGAGKTTTLMMLLGVTEPDEGRVRLLGHPLPEERIAALEQINFAASYLDLPERLSVRQILEVFARIYRVPLDRVDEVVETFGIGALVKRQKSQLSSGQKTLVGLARAMLNRPHLLILDEPTASLDPEVAQRVREILQTAQREREFTLLVTSHNMADIERLCRRVVFLSKGRVVADGAPDEIAARFGVGSLEDTFLTIASGVGV
jgi:ABC-2 type transport system ATP-binding protein